MTENMKKCMELMDKDDEARNKLAESGDRAEEQFREFVIAYGAKNGITLTEEDFPRDAELTDDELDAVAGGCGLSVSFSRQCKCGKQLSITVYCDEGNRRAIPSKCPQCGRKM